MGLQWHQKSNTFNFSSAWIPSESLPNVCWPIPWRKVSPPCLVSSSKWTWKSVSLSGMPLNLIIYPKTWWSLVLTCIIKLVKCPQSVSLLPWTTRSPNTCPWSNRLRARRSKLWTRSVLWLKEPWETITDSTRDTPIPSSSTEMVCLMDNSKPF